MKRADVKALDKLFSLNIRLLSGGYCKKCGEYVGVSGVDCAHCIGRTIHATRWYRNNVAALCRKCHGKLDLNPFEKSEFFRGVLSKGEFEKLYKLSKVIKPSIDVKRLKAELKEQIKILEEV